MTSQDNPFSHILRPEPDRAHTWPSPSAHTPLVKVIHSGDDYTTNGTPVRRINTPSTKRDLELFQHSPGRHSEEHILSPNDMYDYDDWDSDSDGDSEEVELNAGITDFALFEEDLRQARASGQAVSHKWDSMLSSQASAFGRAVERTRIESTDMDRTPSTESIPGLTPDGSPHLHDDLDLRPVQTQTASRPVVPEYLRSIAYSPSIVISQPRRPLQCHNDDEADTTFYVPPRRTQSQPQIRTIKPQRPGLRNNRTLSGKEHVWRHPSWDMFTVREDPVAERKAELASTSKL